MKKFIFFPLWKIEDIENFLEMMERKGFRLVNVKFSYCFCFEPTQPKEVCYFLSYKSFRGESMDHYNYALLSEHKANPVKTKMCYFSVLRTKEEKKKMLLLYEGRLDYIKSKILEKLITSLVITLLFVTLFFLAIYATATITDFCILLLFVGLGIFSTTYYCIGYLKQRKKITIKGRF